MQRSQVLGGVEGPLYELRQPRVVLRLAGRLKKRRLAVELSPLVYSLFRLIDQQWGRRKIDQLSRMIA